MVNEAIITSDIIVKGFVVTENAELIEKYKKIFPNYYKSAECAEVWLWKRSYFVNTAR